MILNEMNYKYLNEHLHHAYMTQSLHAIMWYLFIIWLPNFMRAMHVYLTSLNGVCVCVVRAKHIVQSKSYMV